MADPQAPSTQLAHPWRAVLRTAVAGLGFAATVLPPLIQQYGWDAIPWVAGGITVLSGVTRILANPAVEDWLHDHAPWLASRPPSA